MVQDKYFVNTSSMSRSLFIIVCTTIKFYELRSYSAKNP